LLARLCPPVAFRRSDPRIFVARHERGSLRQIAGVAEGHSRKTISREELFLSLRFPEELEDP
jgi:hypothetical protein